MIRVIIIEDEAPARTKLKKYLERTGETISILKEIETIEETKSYFETSPEADLIISDIELRDGNVFEVYKQISLSIPIIFSTAYDQFWMNAFETSGIEYLLKPYSYARFEKAWLKFKTLQRSSAINQNEFIKQLDAYYQSKVEPRVDYKEFLPIKAANNIYFLKVEEITLIRADYGVIFGYDKANKRHVLNQNSLKDLQEILNPKQFFKINRSEIVNRNFIERISRYTKNTMAIHLKYIELKTSQNTTAAFNSWMGL